MKLARESNGRPGAAADAADTAVAVDTAVAAKVASEEATDELPNHSPAGHGHEHGQGWIRTSEGVSQQIYSLPRLATSVPTLSWAEDSPGRGCARERPLSILIRKIQRSRLLHIVAIRANSPDKTRIAKIGLRCLVSARRRHHCIDWISRSG